MAANLNEHILYYGQAFVSVISFALRLKSQPNKIPESDKINKMSYKCLIIIHTYYIMNNYLFITIP